MGSPSPSVIQPLNARPNLPFFDLEDARWARRNTAKRESDLLLEWPTGQLEAFSLRMAGHGQSINDKLMSFDRRYAVQQLLYAYTLADTGLHNMASTLLFHFEEHQAGKASFH